MKKLLASSSITLVLLVALVSLVNAATGVTNAQVLKDLAAVRQATVKYQDVNQALADGFAPAGACVAEPGVGGMGIHYVNFGRVIDGTINLTEPEVLLYVEKDGELVLVGVEYFFAIGVPGAPVPNPAPPAPMLFDRPFDGPMLGHEPGMPPHYDLHVWVWQANPEGIFTPLNPNIACS